MMNVQVYKGQLNCASLYCVVYPLRNNTWGIIWNGKPFDQQREMNMHIHELPQKHHSFLFYVCKHPEHSKKGYCTISCIGFRGLQTESRKAYK